MHPGRRRYHRSGHGQSDGGQAQTGADYSNQTIAVTPSSNPSHKTSTSPSPANATTKASGGDLQSTTASLLVSFSLLHHYCWDSEQETSVLLHLLNPIQMASRHPV
uniref:Uncharacterized protein n=1 Tax=Rhinolophus ferrumequinum TaxID=59479 RepID=A0A671FPB4_RHIFE